MTKTKSYSVVAFVSFLLPLTCARVLLIGVRLENLSQGRTSFYCRTHSEMFSKVSGFKEKKKTGLLATVWQHFGNGLEQIAAV